MKVYGQDRAVVDSLKLLLTDQNSDTSKIKTLLDIGDQFENFNPDSALLYYRKSERMADSIILTSNSKHKGSDDKIYLTKLYSLLATAVRYQAVVHYYNGSPEEACTCFNDALKIYHQIDEKQGVSRCNLGLGAVMVDYGNYDLALEYYEKALDVALKINEKKGIAKCYTNFGIVYWSQGIYDKATESYFTALRLYEEIQFKQGMADCYNNLGVLSWSQGNYQTALEQHNKTLEIREELDDIRGVSACYLNLGNVYKDILEFEKAAEYYLNSIEIKEELGDLYGLSTCLMNLGIVESQLGEYRKALNYYHRAGNLKRDLGDKNGMAMLFGNIADLYMMISDSLENNPGVASLRWVNEMIGEKLLIDSAIFYGSRGFEIAKEIESADLVYFDAGVLQRAYKAKGNFKKALEYAEIFIETKDTIFSEDKTNALAEMGAKYESEKKQLLIESLNKDNELSMAKLSQSIEKRKKQRILIYSIVAGTIVIMLFSFVLFRMFIQKRKTNRILALQKEQIELQNASLQQANEEINAQTEEIKTQRDLVTDQKEEIEEQKKEIEDSILYAKRIQEAVLISPSLARDILGDHFILFRPKDVVSGDFYWAAKTDEWTIVTVADCTGHGVPGAFMSMLGVSFLNEIVRKKEVDSTGEVLNQLRKSVIDALSQTGEEGSQKDGMDMSVLAIHKDQKTALWSGANNPLWIIRNNTAEITEILPDKMPVAVHLYMENFTDHSLELNSGDRLYLFSDGYQDQFGGPKGKRFLKNPLKNLLIETAHLSMAEQGNFLESELDNWMNFDQDNGELPFEQIDDITFLGLKI